MKRLLVALAGCTFIAVVAPVVQAQEKEDNVVHASLVSPGEGSVVSEVVTLHGRATSPAGIRRAELLVDGEVVAAVTPEDFQQEVDVLFTWDTRETPDGTTKTSNGRYAVSVRGIANGNDAVDTETVGVQLDNIPEQPVGLDADRTGPELRLTWAPNPEPDVFTYQVWRAEGKRYALHAIVDVAGFYEDLKPGTYTYVVIALRSSPHAKKGRASPPSDAISVVINGGPDGDSSFVVDGREAAPKGLPGGFTFPSFASGGLPELPNPSEATESDAGFAKKLPYKVPKEFRILSKPADARERWWNVVPPDGLRWVALGLLFLVVAAQARFIATRVVERSQRV